MESVLQFVSCYLDFSSLRTLRLVCKKFASDELLSKLVVQKHLCYNAWMSVPRGMRDVKRWNDVFASCAKLQKVFWEDVVFLDHFEPVGKEDG